MQTTLLIRDRHHFTAGRSVHDEAPGRARFGVITVIGWTQRHGDGDRGPYPHDTLSIYFDRAADLDGLIDELHALRNDLAAAEGGAGVSDVFPSYRTFWPVDQPRVVVAPFTGKPQTPRVDVCPESGLINIVGGSPADDVQVELR